MSDCGVRGGFLFLWEVVEVGGPSTRYLEAELRVMAEATYSVEGRHNIP